MLYLGGNYFQGYKYPGDIQEGEGFKDGDIVKV